MSRKKISQTKRQVIFARDNWRCCYCGLAGLLTVKKLLKPIRRIVVPVDEQGRGFEIDHVVAVINGGDNSINNLVTSCWSCNNKKGSKKQRPVYQMFRIEI